MVRRHLHLLQRGQLALSWPSCNCPQSPETDSRHCAKVFAGKDASRALGKTSTKADDVQAHWEDLDDKEKSTLNDWVTFFSKRYNIVGVVEGAANME